RGAPTGKAQIAGTESHASPTGGARGRRERGLIGPNHAPGSGPCEAGEGQDPARHVHLVTRLAQVVIARRAGPRRVHRTVAVRRGAAAAFTQQLAAAVGDHVAHGYAATVAAMELKAGQEPRVGEAL